MFIEEIVNISFYMDLAYGDIDHSHAYVLFRTEQAASSLELANIPQMQQFRETWDGLHLNTDSGWLLHGCGIESTLCTMKGSITKHMPGHAVFL